jgi:hypothetical protein
MMNPVKTVKLVMMRVGLKFRKGRSQQTSLCLFLPHPKDELVHGSSRS